MNVYWLVLVDGTHVFYSESPEVDNGETASTGPESQTWRRWLERQFRRLQALVPRPDPSGGFLRRLAARVQGSIPFDEPMLRGLRGATSIVLVHPARLTSPEASAGWNSYLKGRRAHHLWWLGVGLLVGPFTLLLVPLPGPNVVGLWVAFRAICHALVLVGIRRARHGHITIVMRPDKLLDFLIDLDASAERSMWAAELGFERLDPFLARVSARRRPRNHSSRSPA